VRDGYKKSESGPREGREVLEESEPEGTALVELAYKTGIAPNQLVEYRSGRKSPGYETLRRLYRVNPELVIELLEIKDVTTRREQ